ncbi:hypothetical protein RIF29_39005 [Crotalaria pallida]|uniref:Uncharacterized protein n=1 Tax=Crotalaria pallida TaxID=3830 RepID=A0AAN9HQ98_CROPI
MSIPNSWNNLEDKLIWAETYDGIYTVRSTHRMLMAEKELAHASSSNNTPLKGWKVFVPLIVEGLALRWGMSLALEK